jgi:demethylmenaquinone methyltransferase/2-methoxy-6-polyprenyl-1,4-benzoquinol methylase
LKDDDARVAQVRGIFSRVAPVYDLANHILSLRQDVHWRDFTAACLRPGPTGRVLDVATGTADLALAVARLPYKPQVVGLDLVPAMLKRAKPKLRRRAGGRIRLMAGNAMHLPFPSASFDAVTIAFGIRNIPRRVQAMAEMARVLTPGGRLYVLEFTSPRKAWVRRFYDRYLQRLLPAIGGWLSGDRDSYQYLADTIMAFPTPEDFRGEMAAAGFISPRSYALTQGIAWLHIAEKPAG